MNGKKAKAARRLARQAGAGFPERQLLAKSHRAKNGKTTDLFGFSGKVQVINDPRSIRGQYLTIKKLVKRGAKI